MMTSSLTLYTLVSEAVCVHTLLKKPDILRTTPRSLLLHRGPLTHSPTGAPWLPYQVVSHVHYVHLQM